VREVVEDWFRRPGHATQGHFDAASHQRPQDMDAQIVDCVPLNALGGSPGQVTSERATRSASRRHGLDRRISPRQPFDFPHSSGRISPIGLRSTA
jgi:hypothetical protein